jgi:hypothetical protein
MESWENVSIKGEVITGERSTYGGKSLIGKLNNKR